MEVKDSDGAPDRKEPPLIEGFRPLGSRFGLDTKADKKVAVPQLPKHGMREVQRAFSETSLRDVSNPTIMRDISMPFSQGSIYDGQAGVYGQSSVYRNTVFRSVSLGPGFTDPRIDESIIPKPEVQSFRAMHLKAAPPPEPPGGYLEKSTTFHTSIDPQVAMHHIGQILKELDVDFTEKPEKYKYKCEAFSKGSRIPFWIQIFSHESKYAVEMQRRSGDCIEFSRIYNSFMRKCSQCGICSMDLCPSFRAPDVQEGMCFEMDDDQLETTLKPLLEMAGSEYLDMKSSAISAFCELSSGKSVVDWTARNIDDYIKLFEDLLKSKAREPLWAAVSTIANLSTRKDLCEKFNKSSCVSSLVQMTQIDSAHVVREACKALKNIATFCKKMKPISFVVRLNFLHTVGKNATVSVNDIRPLLKSKDARVRQHAEALREMLYV
mmetsp:Transcript_34758/g.67613  ORF Transcript_34758/g.67613 Transcript_34758/m.67613 type:complete len:436 (+) Transcript_34758:53-1360(+)